MVTVTQEGLEKFIELLQSLINLMVSGPIPAVYCMRLSHTITCPFSKYFQILYIFDQIFKYFSLFQHFFAIFLKNHSPKAKWYQFHKIESDEDNDEELEETDMLLESDVTCILQRAL